MSHVVIVATHCDLLPKNIRKKEMDKIMETINRIYTKKSKVYPVIHAVEFVSCYEGKKDFSDISKLACVLYSVAHKVETISSKFFYLQILFVCYFMYLCNTAYRVNQKAKVLDQLIPKGFAELQQNLTGNRIANSDNFEQEAHVLSWSQLKYVIWFLITCACMHHTVFFL